MAFRNSFCSRVEGLVVDSPAESGGALTEGGGSKARQFPSAEAGGRTHQLPKSWQVHFSRLIKTR
eukprot:5884361-Pyramimonas_sp.AAC.1